VIQTVVLSPGTGDGPIYQDAQIPPEEAAAVLEALALEDARRWPRVGELVEWAIDEAARIPEGEEDVWLPPELVYEFGGGDCEDLARLVRAGFAVRGVPAAIKVVQLSGDEWHFLVEFEGADGSVQVFDPQKKGLAEGAAYGGWLDKISGYAKKAAPSLGRAVLRAATGDLIGAATGLGKDVLGAGKKAPARVQPQLTRLAPLGSPISTLEGLQQATGLTREAIARLLFRPGEFYTLTRSGAPRSSRTGKKSDWSPL